jgi:hypothetical protein
MRVHVVTRDGESDNILGRLSRALVTNPAFTLGTTPDPLADLNVFFPYLEHALHVAFDATPTAAWFTHRDEARANKVDMWQAAAEAVDLRLTSAELYAEALSTYGPTALVTVPLDRVKFAYAGRNRAGQERPVIGTSGYVYPAGRKGERLFGKLAQAGIEAEFVASGAGWPVRTTPYPWQHMQDFYHGLDVYVSTSSIEGIGYGPLEALACGVPVVIPMGVGVFDELPALENIHRYKAGDYADLERATREALDTLAQGGYNPASLRGATARYSVEAWHTTWLTACENFLYGSPLVEPSGPWVGKACVYYVAYGGPARDCARQAIASWKRFMPDVPVVFVSDTPLDAGEDVFIPHEDSDIGARSVKTQIYDLCPPEYEYVLYLDADTEVISGDVRFLFDLLEDGWRLVFCTNPTRYVLAGEMRRPDNGPEFEETMAQLGSEEMLQLNGGVFAFRRGDPAARFFRAWHGEWQRYGARDQAALDRALYADPLRVYVLGNEWNTVTRYLPAERSAAILHYPMMARRWRGRINGRLDSSEAWAAVHPGGHQPEATA